ncbi:sensor histidine kinase KdpD [Nereida sp. MMG025]|uniref:sensor histidine kinase n=1 Tax=Nereida sp. MMG025 TaxID=2909981 RepID=UPI001F218F34|nr:HAMP domain-containing sensor histidine kinase [Nereida sp. MMG025]MCF6444244.1 HAMP domain-containing histidine kinase [Nereida sp. MMG025]
MFNTLSGRFLILTIIFVMIAEVLIFVPSVARFREDYLLARLERAQIASLATLENDMISAETEAELLRNAGVFNVVLRRNDVRRLALSSPIPQEIHATFDLRDPSALVLLRDALARLIDTEQRVIRVVGNPVNDAGTLIEVTMDTKTLREAMLDYGVNILWISLLISVVTAGLLFLAVRIVLVRPIKDVIHSMKSYQKAPEDARRIIAPTSSTRELRDAQEALAELQAQLTASLKQKDRLAQLGGAVSKISHDLRNILTSAQLFTDRIESSEDPMVARLAPKLVNSITRAVNLCESTLAFGKAEEPAPTLNRFALIDVVEDVIASERLAVGEFDLSFAEDVPSHLMVRADSEQLYRVLGNLVRNARQAIIANGEAGEIAISAEETTEAWWIRVRDTGPGLPMKAQENLFTAFQGNARKGGTGLGLLISQELIRGHGGSLELSFSDATGTCFEICLPKSDLTIANAAE